MLNALSSECSGELTRTHEQPEETSCLPDGRADRSADGSRKSTSDLVRSASVLTKMTESEKDAARRGPETRRHDNLGLQERDENRGHGWFQGDLFLSRASINSMTSLPEWDSLHGGRTQGTVANWK